MCRYSANRWAMSSTADQIEHCRVDLVCGPREAGSGVPLQLDDQCGGLGKLHVALAAALPVDGLRRGLVTHRESAPSRYGRPGRSVHLCAPRTFRHRCGYARSRGSAVHCHGRGAAAGRPQPGGLGAHAGDDSADVTQQQRLTASLRSARRSHPEAPGPAMGLITDELRTPGTSPAGSRPGQAPCRPSPAVVRRSACRYDVRVSPAPGCGHRAA